MLSFVLIKYQARRWNDDFTIFTICVCGDYFPIPTLYPVTLPERASRSSPSGSGWWCTCSIKTFGFSSALTLITCEILCQIETQTEKRSCGLMDKALDFGSRDWGFESLHDHDTVPPVRYITYGTFFAIILYFSRYIHTHIYIYTYIALDSLECHWMETIALLRRLNSQHQSKVQFWEDWSIHLNELSEQSLWMFHDHAKKKTTLVLLAERSFDLRTSGLWAQHASAAPLCCVTVHKSFKS